MLMYKKVLTALPTEEVRKVVGLFVCFRRDSPPVDQAVLIHEFFRSHTTTHRSR